MSQNEPVTTGGGSAGSATVDPLSAQAGGGSPTPEAAAALSPAVNTSAAPAAVYLKGAVFVFYYGVGGDPGIYMTQNVGVIHPHSWSQPKRLPERVNTSAAPAAIVLNNTLYVFYRGNGNDTGVYAVRSSDEGLTWSMQQMPGWVNTDTTPGVVAALNDKITVFYKGLDGPGKTDNAPVFSADLDLYGSWTRLT